MPRDSFMQCSTALPIKRFFNALPFVIQSYQYLFQLTISCLSISPFESVDLKQIFPLIEQSSLKLGLCPTVRLRKPLAKPVSAAQSDSWFYKHALANKLSSHRKPIQMYIHLPYRTINFNTILPNSRSQHMKQSQTVYIYFTPFCKSTCLLFFTYLCFLILHAEVIRVDLYLNFGITISNSRLLPNLCTSFQFDYFRKQGFT